MIQHNWSVQETEHYSPVLLPVFLKQMVWSDVQFTNKSVEPVRPTGLKCDSESEPVNQYRELSKETSSQNNNCISSFA